MATIDTSDKLKVINDALIATGNNPVNVADDTSDEWRTASSAFDRQVEVLLYRHDWKFANRITTLTRVGDSSYPGFSDVYAKPSDCLYLQTVFRTDQAALIVPDLSYWLRADQEIRPPPLQWKIIEDQIHCVGPYGLTVIYIPFPVGAQPWSVGFRETLTLKVQAFLYSALNEDNAMSEATDRKAEAALALAKERTDQEQPAAVKLRSSIYEARRRRMRGGWW